MSLYEIVDDDFEFINNIRTRRSSSEFLSRERPNLRNILDDDEFYRRFRLSKNSFDIFLEKIRDKLEPKYGKLYVYKLN